MKLLKLLTLSALMICEANLMAQTVSADFKSAGGKKETKIVYISDLAVSSPTEYQH